MSREASPSHEAVPSHERVPSHEALSSHERVPIGPGRLVLVVGPSGAGKDTLIRAARERLAGDPGFVFPRRVVTRPPSNAEDNDHADAETFGRIAAAGGFAMCWRAHGLDYGVPVAIDDRLRDGLSVVCNVSRTIVAVQRARYANVLVIEVTAPASVLADRLARRGRAEDGDIAGRLARSDAAGRVQADTTIVTTGPPNDAADTFVGALTSRR